MSDDFTTAAEMVKPKKKRAKASEPEPEETYCAQDDPDTRSYLEVLCDQAKAALLTASDDRWDESVAGIEKAVDFLAGICKLSERTWAQAHAEEILMTVRFCQSVADLETANILPELDRIRRSVGQPKPNTRGALY